MIFSIQNAFIKMMISWIPMSSRARSGILNRRKKNNLHDTNQDSHSPNMKIYDEVECSKYSESFRPLNLFYIDVIMIISESL